MGPGPPLRGPGAPPLPLSQAPQWALLHVPPPGRASAAGARALRAPKLVCTVCLSGGENVNSPGQGCRSVTFHRSPAEKLLENSLPASNRCPKRHVSKCAEYVGHGAQSSLWPCRQGGGRAALGSSLLTCPQTPTSVTLGRALNGSHLSVVETSPLHSREPGRAELLGQSGVAGTTPIGAGSARPEYSPAIQSRPCGRRGLSLHCRVVPSSGRSPKLWLGSVIGL